MVKKILFVVFAGFLLASASGCVLLVAGAAGGAGTAVWLSGKLSQVFEAKYDRSVAATLSVLKEMKAEVAKETKKKNVTQIRGSYNDGRQLWIDIRKITEKTTRIEVRVGVQSDRVAATEVLKRITDKI
ncbi:MAG: hypothetical protein A2Y00_02965 [Omnitrophica WOR_2 bacterium GWF2_43_52]|nr:MAG: hypothetical protein A2062_05500 [Omnitrophica WOR_2 bacterium GWA2_44_7]OGX14159.1 MAG: hypothetical protein A2Y01_08360 [Omnitrophica WOR_2 bacterium GWC2_44_8]OGX22396.1 MAG: hypothetical protein A2Y00_02965 [Omnitrophica WOR_2 bacterium GWF2_43_52]OGX53270.1 MAG: hypothetical protein A2460_07395 [Omnitrophica WOR_2 bacterium RIFOXYC2_FULL_43_9]HAH20813.1 hypothetical protein [Candidatus Omnitrophota bacterium]